ncbi:YbaB/EbfC family nucleoid-associated protein [Occultella aeris]|uniref:YbaB/EbfC family DNA-binding protein n=1 Tax=Occultella aeris TaxID=2761496 RepID=A0A7M4DPV0_9MICO|nr:YbaB/EbfC family nucleoid-associated protein [Occultella aeris]VZO39494.1 hypothetical protein HALOF300_04186 [Occultella aeris]
MPNEDLDRLADLRDSMDRMSQRIEATQGDLGASRGQDQAGVVTVRLNDDGMFVDVAVLEAWSDEYEADQLGAAVVSAYVAATLARIEQWSTGIDEQDEQPEPRTRPMRPRHEELAAQLDELVGGESDIDATAATRGLIAHLQEFQGILDSAVNAIEARNQERIVGHDGQRRVEVVVDGAGGIAEVNIDPDFAEDSHAFNISRAVTEAIKNALAASAAQSAVALAPVDDLNAMVAKLNDPRGMAAILKPDTYS